MLSVEGSGPFPLLEAAPSTPAARADVAGAAPLRADVALRSSRRALTPDELRNLQKSAKDLSLPKLSRDSNFALFSAWKAAVIDWLAGAGVQGDDLHPDSVKYLAHRLLHPTLHEELRRQGVWNAPTWPYMLSKVRETLGFDR